MNLRNNYCTDSDNLYIILGMLLKDIGNQGILCIADYS